MKIAVNTRLLIPEKLDGIGWFTYETLKRITARYPEHEFVFLFDQAYDQQLLFQENVSAQVVFPPAKHPFLFYWWFEHSIPKVLKKIKPDLFLSPDGYLSLSSAVPSLAVIHDLNFAHYPKDLPWLVRKYYNYYFPKFARHARRIATVSAFSKMDLSKRYQIAPKKIDVVYNGVSEEIQPATNTAKTSAKYKFAAGADYFIYIGAQHPRKNLSRLFLAFDKFKAKSKSDEKLLVVGAKYWWNKEMKDIYNQLKHKTDILFSGRLSEKEKQAALAGAKAMTYVSYFEGFGVPVLEAMKAGIPVIAGNCTSLPEVAGEAAILVDPFSVEAISEAMLELYQNPRKCEILSKLGLERSNQFSWEITSDLLWESIKKTCNEIP